MILDVTLYNLQVLFGMIAFLYAFKKHPELLKVDIKQVIRFSLASFLIFGIQGILLSKETVLNFVDAAYFNGINSLAGVWWEDACFVLPYLILYKILGKKSLFFLPLFVITSLMFMSGHSYQGPAGMVTFIFPFVSFYYARKYGAGTTMLCHIMYDTSIVMCISGLKLLINGAII